MTTFFYRKHFLHIDVIDYTLLSERDYDDDDKSFKISSCTFLLFFERIMSEKLTFAGQNPLSSPYPYDCWHKHA